MARPTPIGAVVRGLVAGLIGSYAQAIYFRATARRMPQTPADAFDPPDEAQKREPPTHTAARRLVEGVMRRELDASYVPIAGEAVHYAYGAAWGGLYGLLRASYDKLGGVVSMLGFATLVWGVSDGVVLPASRLGPWPHKVPMRHHAYYWAAHLVYGTAAFGAYELAERVPWSTALQGYLLRREVRALRSSVADRLRHPAASLAPALKAMRRPVRRALDQLTT